MNAGMLYGTNREPISIIDEAFTPEELSELVNTIDGASDFPCWSGTTARTVLTSQTETKKALYYIFGPSIIRKEINEINQTLRYNPYVELRDRLKSTNNGIGWAYLLQERSKHYIDLLRKIYKDDNQEWTYKCIGTFLAVNEIRNKQGDSKRTCKASSLRI